jgi:Holliday junction DNA helicase RuvA
VQRLTAVPGIGKRTAERIVVELREKVGAADDLPDGDIVVRRADDPRELARQGLVELGFGELEADRLLADLRGDTPEDLLQQALRAARS